MKRLFGVNNEGIGICIDIENISRFQGLTIERDIAFLNKLFTEKELDYCFSLGNPSHHLAARYAGKEAIIKALSTLDRANLSYKEIEIVNDDRGIPGASSHPDNAPAPPPLEELSSSYQNP